LVSAQFDFSKGAYARVTGLLERHAIASVGCCLVLVAMGGLLSAILVNDIVAFALTPLLCQTLNQRGLDRGRFLLAAGLVLQCGSVATLDSAIHKIF